MGQVFDFEHYYTLKSASTDIHLDVSGIDLKTSGSAESSDGDTVSLNQYITNNVIYKVSRIVADDVDITQDEILQIIAIDDDGNTDTVYTSLGYPIDDLVAIDLVTLPENASALGTTTLGSTLADGRTCSMVKIEPDGSTSMVSSVVIYAVARFRLENPDLAQSGGMVPPYYIDPGSSIFNNVNQNFWHMGPEDSKQDNIKRIIAGVGLNGERWKGMSWYKKIASKNPVAVVKYDNFRKRINYASNILKENGIGVTVTYYSDDYSDPVTVLDATSDDYKKRPTWAKQQHKRYISACKASDWTKTSFKPNAKYSQVYGSGEMETFISEAVKRGVMNDIIGDKSTALIPNMSDVVKRFFYDADTLANDFNDEYYEVLNGLLNIHFVRKFMRPSIRRKLSAQSKKLRADAYMDVNGVKTPVEAQNYAIDITSFVKMLNTWFDNAVYPSIVYRPIGGKNDCMPRAISNFGELICQASCSGVNDEITVTNYTIDGLIADGETVTSCNGLLYENIRNELKNKTINSDYRDWLINTEERTIDDLKEYFAEAYTDVYNKHYGLSETDTGYCTWTYDGVTIRQADDSEVTLQQNNSYSGVSLVKSPTTIQSIVDNAVAGSTPSIEYGGSATEYIDICLGFINALNKNRRISASTTHKSTVVSVWDHMNVPDTILCAAWDTAATANDNVNFEKYEPSYRIIDDLNSANISVLSDAIEFYDVMDDAITNIELILATYSMIIGATPTLLEQAKLLLVKLDYNKLRETVEKIKWYQMFTNESVFDTKLFIGKRGTANVSNLQFSYMPARLLIPVHMYKKVKKKYKVLGFTRHKTVKQSIGVRWAEVKFIDNDVYSAYPMNNNEPRQFYMIGKDASLRYLGDGNAVFSFDNELEGDTSLVIPENALTQFGHGDLLCISQDGVEYPVTFTNSREFTSTSTNTGLSDDHIYVYGIYVPLEATQPSDELTTVNVEYKMPYLPYNSELKRYAFMTYGPFDQSKYAEQSREVPADYSRVDGWRIFKNSSKRIGDLRANMGIYDAVAILIGILKNTYGAQQVSLIETVRSLENQEKICSGDAESKFLSWHNYGLSVKILITDKDRKPIADGSDDMRKLIDVAEAFTVACRNGAFGKPLNVVWCGRLLVGANIFVWEFLPIGVNHKDAPKFRDELLNQGDPIAKFGYIDVDANGLAVDVKPDQKIPYIWTNSDAYKNAIIINGHHYVSPEKIMNYELPHDLVLLNILEFINMIDTKMAANGTAKNDRGNMYEWKSLNERSYRQLIIYFAMVGNVDSAMTLLCGDYVERYQNIVDTKFSENYVDMVKSFLGDALYNDIKIKIANNGDGGAWISLNDGKLHIKNTDINSKFSRNSKGNFFGERQTTATTRERGQWINGIFYNEAQLDEMGYISELVSEKTFLQGFDSNGDIVGGDALLIHSLIATQIKTEFDKIRERFESYGGSLMYDVFANGPNASMTDMLENEFGVIEAQDLISFDKLRTMFHQDDINNNARKSSDGTLNGVVETDIYEKVVSNAMLSGVRKAVLSKEHVEVNARVSGMTVEQLYKKISQGRGYTANDIIRR